MILYVAIAVLLLAFIGALLHPLALLLRALPVDAGAFLGLLVPVRTFISNLLFWGFLSGLALMAIVVVRGRFALGKPGSGTESGHQARGVQRDAPSSPMKMVVAITAYNEGQAIARVVEDFRAQKDVVQVIVIDNNSGDDTAVLAAGAGAKVVRESQQGYGYACTRGLREALRVPEAEVIVLTEGDGTFAASDLAKFQAYIGQADMVVGTRVVPGLVEDGSQMDHFFIWGNIFASALMRMKFWNLQFLGATSLSDLGCTFRVVRREGLERIIGDMDVGGNHFSPHMIMAAMERGLSVIEIPVTFRRRIGESKGASQSIWKGLQVGLAMIWHILTFRLPPPKANGPQDKVDLASETD